MSDGTQEVKRLLAGLRYPAMPDHLADRIEAAIGAEAAFRAGGEAMSRVVVSSISRSVLARQEAAQARAEARLLHEDVRKLAGLVGATEHAMATTMERLASQNPTRADFLGELSRAAEVGATQAMELA